MRKIKLAKLYKKSALFRLEKWPWLKNTVFADERVAYGHNTNNRAGDIKSILIGPEGGFSDSEFTALDNAGAVGISLGKTILRAELASAIAIAKVTLNGN